MEIIIYSKNNCPNCQIAKNKLNKFNPIEIMLGKDISREDFFKKFPNVKSVPQIVINNQYIGSLNDLEKWLAFNSPNNDF